MSGTARFSLRTRVLAATLALVAIGLSAAGIATYGFLRSFLVHRLDQQLVAAEFPASSALKETLQFGHPDSGPPGTVIPGGTYAALLDSSGKVLASTFLGYAQRGRDLPTPELPSGLPGSEDAGSGPATSTFTTIGSSGSGFRVVAQRALINGTTPGTLVVAIPLTEISGTLHRLVLVEIAVAAGVLLAVVAGPAGPAPPGPDGAVGRTDRRGRPVPAG